MVGGVSRRVGIAALCSISSLVPVRSITRKFVWRMVAKRIPETDQNDMHVNKSNGQINSVDETKRLPHRAWFNGRLLRVAS